MESKLQIFNMVLFWCFSGLLCAWIAPKKNRNPGVWFLIGALFSLFAVGVILLLPPVKQRKKAPPKPKSAPLPPSEVCQKVWFYLDTKHAQQGPVDFSEINKIWKEKELSNQSYIWAEGMESWKKIQEVPEVVKELHPSGKRP